MFQKILFTCFIGHMHQIIWNKYTIIVEVIDWKLKLTSGIYDQFAYFNCSSINLPISCCFNSTLYIFFHSESFSIKLKERTKIYIRNLIEGGVTMRIREVKLMQHKNEIMIIRRLLYSPLPLFSPYGTISLWNQKKKYNKKH